MKPECKVVIIHEAAVEVAGRRNGGIEWGASDMVRSLFRLHWDPLAFVTAVVRAGDAPVGLPILLGRG